MPQDDVAGIVAFGKGALVERLPAELREIDRIASAPVTSATDIGGALRLASALFPDDAQKRIVLLSDGNDTTGQGQAEAALAAARGIQVETKTIGLGATEEVLVERITAPSTSRLGEEIEVSADIRSTTAQPATVRLFANGVQVGEEHLDLDAGTTPVTFRVKPADAGFLRFRVVVEAALNTFSQNDRADANTIVQGEPRTLVVSGDEAVAAELVGALKTERQQVDQLPAEGLSSDPLTLAEYDSIVLVDVPRTDLTDRQMLALQVYVRDLGKGLVMVGGPACVRRRRLREDADRGDAAGRHGRPRPGEAARHRARRRHRQVGLDGRLPLQLVQPRWRWRPGDRRRPQGRHRQGGDPAGCGRDDVA